MTHENAPKLKPVVTNPAEGDAAGRRVPLQSPQVYYAGQYVPVRLATTRQQMFANMGHRAETEQRVALGAGRDGKLTAIIHEGLTHTKVKGRKFLAVSVAIHSSRAGKSRQLHSTPISLWTVRIWGGRAISDARCRKSNGLIPVPQIILLQ